MEATALSIGKSVLSGALGYAKSALAEEVALQLGITRDQAFVRDELEMMLSFLMAAHEERDKHMVVETWVKQVRVVAYDVEDSLMDFAVRVEKKSWWLPWRIPRNLRDRRRVGKQMKDLRAKVEDVSQRKRRYLIEGGSSSKATASAGDTAASAAAMFGINEARYAAKTKDQPRLDLSQLINQEGEDLAVIALWGTSGNVGHTSIIWEAYDNSSTQKNFHCRAWVRVMHPFGPKEFIRSLLEEAVHVGVDFLMETEKTGQALVEEFLEYVNDKRCLIVLNDLSTIEEWNRVKKCLPINKNGNRIVVSTTDVEVASLCVGQNYVVSELKQLSAGQTIYAFYKELPTATLCVQISTTPDFVQRAGDEDGNNCTKVMEPNEVADKAIEMMQRTTKHLMCVCKEKLQSRKALNVYELKELQVALENIDDGWDQDSLFCQSHLDAKKKEDHLDDYLEDELAAEWPESPREPCPEDFISFAEHIETFWGIEYDSDNMPSFSD